MRDSITQALIDMRELFGEGVFSAPSRFKAGLSDVMPGSANELARNLLNIAVGGMNAHSRLKSQPGNEIATCVHNLIKEMSGKHGVSDEMAGIAIEAVAALFGYTPSVVKRPVASQSVLVNPSIDALLDGARVNLELSEWDEARQRFNDILKADPRSSRAYIGRLCAELRLDKEHMLSEHNRNLNEYMDFKKALSFADSAYRMLLNIYNDTVLRRISNENSNKQIIGSIRRFGPYSWRVLDVRDKKALLISGDVLERRPYNTDYAAIKWKQSSIRQYLNGTFLNSFNPSDKSKIIETTIINPDNAQYGINGGGDTVDSVFLLSLDEASGYFKDMNDRAAALGGTASWWWLRSPGRNSQYAARVRENGELSILGYLLDNISGGVRPAMWVNL